MSRSRSAMVVALMAASMPGMAPAQSRPSSDAFRGIADAVEFQASGPTLRATANQSRLSPVLVRIAETRPATGDDVLYRVEFVGLVAGSYDLRDYLERQDGSPLNLPPIPVMVESKLDARHGTDLFSTAQVPPLGGTRYRVIMIILGGLWLGVPIVYLLVRILARKSAPPPAIAAPPPTLAEQLRPLVEAALRGSLSLADRARLELMMYLYWRDRLQLEGPQAEVVRQLRRDPQAGKLLQAVEGWLHSGRTQSARAEDEVAALLEPYRAAQAIPEFPVAGSVEKPRVVLEHAR